MRRMSKSLIPADESKISESSLLQYIDENNYKQTEIEEKIGSKE